jgi:hypothetical protein
VILASNLKSSKTVNRNNKNDWLNMYYAGSLDPTKRRSLTSILTAVIDLKN